MQVLWMLTADDGTPVRAEMTKHSDDVELVIGYRQTIRELSRFPSHFGKRSRTRKNSGKGCTMRVCRLPAECGCRPNRPASSLRSVTYRSETVRENALFSCQRTRLRIARRFHRSRLFVCDLWLEARR